ncbi:MAG: homoaconitate hydratase [Candidatus Hermodarchaeota archaeon]|nr:homoaconitate hydratase [Candidatus Hermodarchaeota archaeon]
MTTELEAAGLIVNHNRRKELRLPTTPDRVHIWDETLRDGEQTAGTLLTVDEKIEIAKLMDEVGVAVIAAGFPMVSQEEQETIRRLSNEGFQTAKLAAPARAVLKDVQACIDAGADVIPIFIAPSKLRLEFQLKMTLDEAIDRLTKCTEYAVDHGAKVAYVVEDATRSDLEKIVRISAASIEAGADTIVLADTVGFCRPGVIQFITKEVTKKLSAATKKPFHMGIHCHNDFGLAAANTLAAVEMGVTYPHVCVNGFGERAGNAALEEVVMALEILYGVKTGIKTERLYELSKLVERSFAIPIPVHKAIVGQNAFNHGSGIHVHGTLAHSLSYEPIPPSLVGRERSFYLGKFAGRHLIEYILRQNNIMATKEQVSAVAEAVKQHHAQKDKAEILMRFDQCKSDFSQLKADLSVEEVIDLAKDIIEREK